MRLPLEGITVVAVEQAVAAPFATRQLADFGARVIKIERRGAGDFARAYDHTVKGMSSFFVWLNRSKESLALDLKHPAARVILHRLLTKADVFMQNLVPGAGDRLGLGSDELRRNYPRMIVWEISGYGKTGPYRNRKAYDLLIQSEAGLVSITGTEENPSKVGISIADIAAGMYAYSGILTALIAREKTGEGLAFEVSLLEALGEWMSQPAYYTGYGGTALPRSAASHAAIAPYGPFRTGDGKTIYLGVQNQPEWCRFCPVVLERPDLATDERFGSNAKRVEHRRALDDIIGEVFGLRSAEEMINRLEKAQIAYGGMNTVAGFLQHPQLGARERWRSVESPVGPLRALIPPVAFEGLAHVMRPIPDVGEHTTPILSELGFDDRTIQEWRQAGVI